MTEVLTDNALAQGFAHHIAKWALASAPPGADLAALQRAAAGVCEALQQGHVCLPLEELYPGAGTRSLQALRASLLATGQVVAAGSGQVAPLVLDTHDRLYLYRYHDYETRLAGALVRRAAQMPVSALALQALRPRLESLFPSAGRDPSRPDWQKLAVALALLKPLVIISGGPGTGKTSSVVALLACLLEQQPALRVALAAPTGKAAARLVEALRTRAEGLPELLRARLPTEAFTVHRLLGVTGAAGKHRHHAQNPLPLDALIVDEASMLDLSLATRLVEALPETARLILLGDKDQLAAVEAGAVFAEISADPSLGTDTCAALSSLTGVAQGTITPPAGSGVPGLRDSVVWLQESHRFSADSGIGRLAADIRAGRAQAAFECLEADTDGSLRWLPEEGAGLSRALAAQALAGFDAYFQAVLADRTGDAGALDSLWSAFDRFRVLCALREGPRGAVDINLLCERRLKDRVGAPATAAAWFAGRPVMLSRNDYELGLFNGDVGICLPDADGQPKVYFRAGGAYRAVAPVRLPEHEGAFALTVHKAQGSEFEEILLVLPGQNSRGLTRELLYTGVTRAARRLALAGSRAVIVAACRQPTRRHSGLAQALHGGG